MRQERFKSIMGTHFISSIVVKPISKALVIFLLALFASLVTQAQCVDCVSGPPTALERVYVDFKELSKAVMGKATQFSEEVLADALRKGQTDVYVTSICHHGRGTYNPEQVERLNEFCKGGGVGKSWTNEKGEDEMIYAMVFADSHNEPEYIAGYGWQKRYRLSDKVDLGYGLTAGFTHRRDLGLIPVLLPLGSLNLRLNNGKRFSLLGTYIPPSFNSEGASGDVLFVFGRYTFEKEKR